MQYLFKNGLNCTLYGRKPLPNRASMKVNNTDSDKMPRLAASILDLHCLLKPRADELTIINVFVLIEQHVHSMLPY